MPNSEKDSLFIVGERLGRFRTIEPGGVHAGLLCTCGFTFVLLLAVIFTSV
jgi:hypothetical protein